MFDVTSFLMRWLFLSNLVRDVAEIQTLPFAPQYSPMQHVEQTVSIPVLCEEEWRDNCLRGILSYPPGTQRLLVMDAMRAELVNKLSVALRGADETIDQYEKSKRILKDDQRIDDSQVMNTEEEDPFLDADLEILRAFELETSVGNESTTTESSEQAVLVISRNETLDDTSTANRKTHSEPMTTGEAIIVPSSEDVRDARKTVRVVRDYLPQLVSIVLKSPPAFEPNLLNPIEKLRQLVIQRCVDDANWGVDMCWLLEAEVGRAWKTLFEHRQQTGRRLIVVLPAEKAAVLAKIGTEKREAFDLLQDSEQATAYGYTIPMNEAYYYNHQQQEQLPSRDAESQTARLRLPSSLSLRRCSHFGDTMHFIDRLTKISLDMRKVPVIHRHGYLQESLREMNRRIRRRMITRGDVSLDVEDNRRADDWPQLADITNDMLQYSVHLPLDPMQQDRWPGGEEGDDVSDGGVVRILNIVVEECRTLSSRERCPYLIHVEVAESGLRGNDSRLYANGAASLGATIGEALAMTPTGSRQADSSSFQIPAELLESTKTNSVSDTFLSGDSEEAATVTIANRTDFIRGGYQQDESMYYSQNPDDVWASHAYDNVRQPEYEQLHQQMYVDQNTMVQEPQPQHPAQRDPMLSTGAALLDRVFGQEWSEKCEEIRQASPYGKTEGWRLASFIIKAGEDIRREALVMQVISKLNQWFQDEIPERFRPKMRPYTIMCVGGDAGLVECLSDAKSIDEVKKKTDGFESLKDYFIRAFGPPQGSNVQQMHPQNMLPGQEQVVTFEEAQDNFLRSLAGYSLVCYILQIKDRHNANILIDRAGNVMHIDFGFVLGDTPKMSKVPIFSERAPFKLSGEFWEVLGGWDIKQGGLGVKFCNMFEQAFACASGHSEEIVSLVEATMLTLSNNPRQARMLANGVRARLRMRGAPGSPEQKRYIMELVDAALTSWGTSTYDWLQKNMNGYQ